MLLPRRRTPHDNGLQKLPLLPSTGSEGSTLPTDIIWIDTQFVGSVTATFLRLQFEGQLHRQWHNQSPGQMPLPDVLMPSAPIQTSGSAVFLMEITIQEMIPRNCWSHHLQIRVANPAVTTPNHTPIRSFNGPSRKIQDQTSRVTSAPSHLHRQDHLSPPHNMLAPRPALNSAYGDMNASWRKIVGITINTPTPYENHLTNAT